MSGNIIIILFFIITVVATYYSLKSGSRPAIVLSLLICLPYILMVLSLNISCIFMPFTSKVDGKVIDADSKKPIAGINVKVGWYVGSSSVGGGSGNYYKIYSTKTDSNGQFTIPRGIKALSVEVPPIIPLITRSFKGISITIYPDNYDYKAVRKDRFQGDQLEIALKPVKTDKDFLENIVTYWNSLSELKLEIGQSISDQSQTKWLKNSYYEFEKKYPNSNEDKDYLEDLAHILNSINAHETVYVLNKLLIKYPDSVHAYYARNWIDIFRTKYNTNIGGKK